MEVRIQEPQVGREDRVHPRQATDLLVGGASGHEYGCLSNVNPFIPHPRWSQRESHWVDTKETFPTPIFNGYGPYVAALYPNEPRTPQKPLIRGKRAR